MWSLYLVWPFGWCEIKEGKGMAKFDDVNILGWKQRKWIIIAEI